MIRATLLLGRDGQTLKGFSCMGHAGFDRAGRDIVCAAVSALTITCVNALESVAGIKPGVFEKEGTLRVILPENSENHDAQVILSTLRQGLTDLAAQYPAYVTLTEKSIMEE